MLFIFWMQMIENQAGWVVMFLGIHCPMKNIQYLSFILCLSDQSDSDGLSLVSMTFFSLFSWSALLVLTSEILIYQGIRVNAVNRTIPECRYISGLDVSMFFSIYLQLVYFCCCCCCCYALVFTTILLLCSLELALFWCREREPLRKILGIVKSDHIIIYMVFGWCYWGPLAIGLCWVPW